MSTDTAKTTQQRTGWVACDLGGKRVRPIKKAVCVYVEGDPDGTFIIADIEKAQSDPANVLNVDAYPAVVKALKRRVDVAAHLLSANAESTDNTNVCRCDGCTALAVVHPEGAET